MKPCLDTSTVLVRSHGALVAAVRVEALLDLRRDTAAAAAHVVAAAVGVVEVAQLLVPTCVRHGYGSRCC